MRDSHGLVRRLAIAGLFASTFSLVPASATQAPTSLKTFEIAEVWVLSEGEGTLGGSVHGFELSARLTSGGVGVSGRSIAFSAQGSPVCTAVTTSSGWGTCRLWTGILNPTVPAPGWAVALATNNYDASFAGDEQFLPSDASGPVVLIR